MTIEISVTQQDLDQGCKMKATDCAIARAVNRLLSEQFESQVFQHIALFDGCPTGWGYGGRVWSTLTPDAVFYALREWDNGVDVKPFTFTLDIPAIYLKGEA